MKNEKIIPTINEKNDPIIVGIVMSKDQARGIAEAILSRIRESEDNSFLLTIDPRDEELKMGQEFTPIPDLVVMGASIVDSSEFDFELLFSKIVAQKRKAHEENQKGIEKLEETIN